MLKAECPVCRQPLVFRDKKINSEEIKEKELKEMVKKKSEIYIEDELLARRLNNQRDESDDISDEEDISDISEDIVINTVNNTNTHNMYNNHDDVIQRVLEESIATAEMDDYEYIAKMLKYSYEYEENEAIERQLKYESETIYETIDRLMNGEKSVVIKLY